MLRVAACSSGCPAVDRTMVLLLQHMLWNLPAERETIRKTVFEFAISGGISTEKLRQEAEDLQAAVSIAKKNELPVKVVCDSCGEEFRLRQEIETHHISHPNHSYTLKTEGSSRIYPYDNLVREIDSLQETAGKADTLSRARKEVFEKELKALADRVERVKYRLEEERELLKNLMEANIWLSTLDRNEALLLHDTRSTELSELNDLISKSRSMLGLRADRHSLNLSLQKQSEQEMGREEMEKIPVSDSGSSVNSFMKGIGSRFKLR